MAMLMLLKLPFGYMFKHGGCQSGLNVAEKQAQSVFLEAPEAQCAKWPCDNSYVHLFSGQ